MNISYSEPSPKQSQQTYPPASMAQGGKLLTGNPEFNGHKLELAPASRRVQEAVSNECVICLDSLSQNNSRDLSLLPCFHVYHKSCMTKTLEVQNTCPQCKDAVSEHQIKTYRSIEKLKAELPVKCSEGLCTATGSPETVQSGVMAQCPYPLSSFPYQETDRFLESNSDQIIEWLKEAFEQKGYSSYDVKYTPNYYSGTGRTSGKPAISLKAQFNQSFGTSVLYYSSHDINNAITAEEAFKHLLEDLRTDLLFLSLRKTHPAMFDGNTDLYIRHYDLWDDAIYLNDFDHSIPLRSVFDPSTKIFSWNKLKEELSNNGFEYRELFESGSSARYCVATDGGSDSETLERAVFTLHSRTAVAKGGALNPAAERRVVAREATELPTGEYNTDEFMF